MDMVMEDFFPDLTGNDTEDDTDHFEDKDEFWHSQGEFGISEHYMCKKMLYQTLGSSTYKVYDMVLLISSCLYLTYQMFTFRTIRHQLTTTHQRILYILLTLLPIISSLHSLLLLFYSTPLVDKIDWTIIRTIALYLEFVSVWLVSTNIKIFARSTNLSTLIVCFPMIFCIWVMTFEISAPAKEFHVYSSQTDLYGEGGGLVVCLTSLLLSTLYSTLLIIMLRVDKTSNVRYTFYLVTMMVVNMLRGIGGLLLFIDSQFGMCLTSVTQLFSVTLILPLIHWCLLGVVGGVVVGYNVQHDEEEDISIIRQMPRGEEQEEE